MTSVQECVFNLIPRENTEEHTKTRHKTIGLAQYPKPTPNDYLKKSKKSEIQLCDKKTEEQERIKDPLPDPTAKPIHGLKTNKNFIKQNAAEVIMSIPQKPFKYIVDQRNGEKFSLDPSGLECIYIKKEDYGKMPQYLVNRNNKIKEAKLQYEEYLKDLRSQNAMYQISDKERDEILNGLKANWQNYYHQYQSLSVMVDTITKKNRKEWLENEMKVLEKEIEKIERHKIIYVAK